MAYFGSSGKLSWLVMYLCKLSLKNSAHALPLCPSKMPKKLHFGQSESSSFLSFGGYRLVTIDILSLLYYFVSPWCVIAENPCTTPTPFDDILAGQSFGIAIFKLLSIFADF